MHFLTVSLTSFMTDTEMISSSAFQLLSKCVLQSTLWLSVVCREFLPQLPVQDQVLQSGHFTVTQLQKVEYDGFAVDYLALSSG